MISKKNLLSALVATFYVSSMLTSVSLCDSDNSAHDENITTTTEIASDALRSDQSPNVNTDVSDVALPDNNQQSNYDSLISGGDSFIPDKKLDIYTNTYNQGDWKINSIKFNIHPYMPVSDDSFLRSHLFFQEGDSFDPSLTDNAIKSLFATNIFEKISIDAWQKEDHKLDVVIDLTARPKIRNLKYSKKLSKKAKKEIKVQEGDFFNEALLNDDKHALYQYYQTRGFPIPSISYDIVPTDNPQFVDVNVNIEPGKKQGINKIKFLNSKDVPLDEIREKMLHKEHTLFSFFTGKGYFVEPLLEVDKQTVISECHNAGYLDAKILSAEFVEEGDAKSNKHSLVFDLDLGEKYFVGDITYPEDVMCKKEQLENLTLLHTGDVFSPRKISETIENYKKFYGYHGYVDLRADIATKPTFTDDNKIDLMVTIREGERSTVGNIIVNGNYKTKTKVILREMAIAPGDVCNTMKIKNSEARLKNTEYFSKVEVEHNASDKKNVHDIEVNVDEQNTGKFIAGVSANSKNSQAVFLELIQSNFSWDSSHKFAGDGQKIRLRGQLGTRESGLTASFVEPWLCDRELTFGVDTFFHKTQYRQKDDNYSGPSYNYNEVGAELYLRKRLWELWCGRLSYNITRKHIKDVDDNAIQPLQDEKGRSTSSRVKFLLDRDTRDNYLFPMDGSYIGIENQFAGLGGNVKLYRFDIDTSFFFTISEKYEHILALSAKCGSIFPFGHHTNTKDKKRVKNETPYSERFFLGGDSMMRGFEFRDISPRAVGDNDKGETVYGDALGGNSYVYFGAEYTAKIFDRLYIAGFAELGCVNAGKFKFFDNYNADIGFGFRIFAMGMPVRLDFGYPVKRSKTTPHRSSQFNFSVGTSF